MIRLKEVGKVLWKNSKFWVFLWLALSMFAVICGYPFVVAFQSVALKLRPFFAFGVGWSYLILYSPRFLRFVNLLMDWLLGGFEKISPERFEAWSARAVVTLIALFGLLSLLFTASAGGLAAVTGIIISAALAIIFWMLMSWTDTLQTRAKTKRQTFWGVVQLLVVLGVGWVGFIGVLLIFTR